MRKHFYLFLSLLFIASTGFAQKVMIEGYVFEDGNRGYLNEVEITVLEKGTKALKTKARTNKKGVFLAEVDPGGEYIIKADKKVFAASETVISTIGKKPDEKVYVKINMKREPGYRFEVTIAPKRASEDIAVDAIHGARVEVFNNTTKKGILDLQNLPTPTFACNFEQGNHYTIMIRKEGYFVKRMEAYVNVKGCILCFDGVGEVTPGQPGVADVLTEGNKMGTLLANVEMLPISMNKGITVDNIYYDYNSSRLKTASRTELDKLAIVLNDNSSLLIELGAHTDSRGKDNYNLSLSKKRAKAAVDYLVNKGVDKQRIISKGYGETELANKCNNNAKCTEDQHARNRRTELKVVGMLSKSLQENKSLVELKEEEAFEEMLKEIQNQDEIKIANPDDIPEEMKKELEKKEAGKDGMKEEVGTEMKDAASTIPVTTESTAITKVEEIIETVNAVEEVGTGMKDAATNIPVTTESTAITKVEEVIETVNAVEEVVEEVKISTPVVTEKPKIIEKVETIKESVTVPTEMPKTEVTRPAVSVPSTPKISTTVEKPIATTPSVQRPVIKEPVTPSVTDLESEEFNTAIDIEEEDPTSEWVPGQREVDTASGIEKGAHLMAMEYTGYMVQFFTSPYELPGSHEVFSKHGNITMDQIKDGTYAYLLGDFSNEEDATNFLMNIMKQRYPKARVIRYKRGNRLN